MRWCNICVSCAIAQKNKDNTLAHMNFFKKKHLADAVIFMGMVVNAVLIVLILFYYVF